jgi:hypothetical protein
MIVLLKEETMKNLYYMMLVVLVTFSLVACSAGDSAENAAETAEQPVTETADQTASVAPASTATPSTSAPAASSTRTPAPAATPRPASPAPAAPRVFEVPGGTNVSVLLIDPVSSATNAAGDQFLASIAEPIIVNGQTIVERGTKVQGRVVNAEGAGRVRGVASIQLALTGILDGDRVIPISTEAFVSEAETTRGRDAAVIGGAAGIGAAIGAIAGGKSGAGTGALIGGAAGTGTVLATRGREVEFGSETRLEFKLDKAVSLPRVGPRIS